MRKIRAITIDDELHNRKMLSMLLKNHCPQIELYDEASNADEAFQKIRESKPDLIFLDIRMPEKNGFELLRMFSKIDFEVIFVTAYDEYAIRAFEFNALGYILKPIDFEKLISVVEKAITTIYRQEHASEMVYFIKTIEEQEFAINKITVHHNNKVVFLALKDIVSVEAEQSSCTVKLADLNCYVSGKSFASFEQFLDPMIFIKIHRGIIINIHHIKTYTKGSSCIIEMINGQTFEVSRRKKAEILDILG